MRVPAPKSSSLFRAGWLFLVLAALLSASSCAPVTRIRADRPPLLVAAGPGEGSPAERFAPAFFIHNPDAPENRIGRPLAFRDDKGRPSVRVTNDDPAFYFLPKEFSTEKGSYENLVYRVHFEKIPFSFTPFMLTAGDNVGLLVVITLDAAQRPVLVTCVHTCGCYMASVPTNHLPAESLPKDWTGGPLPVYGETLPGNLDFKSAEDPVLVVYLRPGGHRVMDLKVVGRRELPALAGKGRVEQADILPMEDLTRLPFEGGTITIYEEEGVRAGYVRGSFKPLETLLMGVFSWSLYIGSDKDYDSEAYGNRFFTSLVPWNREESDMWDFARFLKFWGWNL